MKGKAVTIVMHVIAIGMAVAFFAVPIVKLKDPALVIVVLIGVAAMIYNFIEELRTTE